VVASTVRHADTRGAYSTVEQIYIVVGLVVLVTVLVAMVVIVVRNRARPGRAARPTGKHRRLELGIAALIALIAAGLVAVTLQMDGRASTADAKGAAPGLRVDITAFRWGWSFRYPQLGGVVSTSPPTRAPAILRVPADTTVRFRTSSRDVIHSFWIPELRFKRDLFPGRHDEFDLHFPAATTFMGGHCAEFCGLEHSDMNFSVEVLPRRDFDAWIAAARARPA
jgi:cytochrome c oxidase subunit 2